MPDLTVAGGGALIAAATTGGLTIFGHATGLAPDLLIAGALGGLWSLTKIQDARPWDRVAAVAAGSLLAAIGVQAGVELLAGIGVQVSAGALRLPVAVAIGFLAHSRIAPAMMRLRLPGNQEGA
jgi:hypothetical protein